MTLIQRSDSRPSDSRVDEDLRELFAPTAPPSVRTGFDRRLAHAIAADLERSRRSRTMRRVLWSYWTCAAIGSIVILWQLQERLLTGGGLWLGLGLLTLVAASLSFSALTALPLKPRRRLR